MKWSLFILIVSALSPAAASATVGTIELERSAHLPITPPAGLASGSVAAGVGDVNADGTADFAIGYPRAAENGRTDSGSVFVVYGRSGLGPVDLAALGTGGFRIDGDAGDLAGTSVSAAGDVNADGVGDLLVGAPGALFAPDPTPSGAAFLVFGTTAPANVDLAAMGPRVVALVGDQPDVDAGWAVSGGRDINGDGKPDLLVGAPAQGALPPIQGAAFVVFGGTGLTPGSVLDLGALGTGGVTILGDAVGDETGSSVSLARDVSADGRDDILIGTPGSDANSLDNSGSASVIFGSANLPSSVDLGALGNLGRRSHGGVAGRAMGTGIVGAGDTNGDGVGDIAVFSRTAPGSPTATSEGFVDVVFGSSVLGGLEVGPSTPGLRIARLVFAQTGAQAAGDLNRDGRDDLLVSGTLNGSRIVYGRTSPGTVEVPPQESGAPDPSDVRGLIEIPRAGSAFVQLSGRSLAGIGDVTHDGNPDIFADARTPSPNPSINLGDLRARIVTPVPPSISYSTPLPGLDLRFDRVMTPLIPTVTSTGTRSFAVASRFNPIFERLHAGLTLDPLQGSISGQPTQEKTPLLQGPTDRTITIRLVDGVGTATTPLRIVVRPPTAQELAADRRLGGLKAVCRPFGPRIAGKRRCRIYLEFSLPQAAKVVVTLKRGARTVGKTAIALPAGKNRIDLRRRLGPRRTVPVAYSATLVATVDKIAGPAARVRFKVTPRAG